MPLALECNNLFQLPQGCHQDAAVGALYIRLIDDELYLVTMFPAICPQGGPKGLNAIHASTGNIIMADHGVRREIAVRLVLDQSQCVRARFWNRVDG